MPKSIKNNMFGTATIINEEVAPIAQEIVPMIETPVVTAQSIAEFALENARAYARRESTPSIYMTQAEIDAASVRPFFEEMIRTGRIGITKAANASRKEGIEAVYSNRYQMAQIARMLAFVEHNIHTAWEISNENGERQISLADNFGDHDRVVVGRVNQNDRKVYYQTYYANKSWNAVGDLAGLDMAGLHPIGKSIQDALNTDWVDGDGVIRLSYNHWVDQHNADVRAFANGTASDEQIARLKNPTMGTLNPNQFVQYNSVYHINADTIVNKYQLEAWMLLNSTRPAFEIVSYAKSAETMGKFLDGVVGKMERAYKQELAVLAGLLKFENNSVVS